MTKTCAHCGKEFVIDTPLKNAKKYCSRECVAEVIRIRNREKYNKRKKSQHQVNAETKPAEERKYCKRYDCLYHPYQSADNNCDYTLITGEPRGCPGGERCTRYKHATPAERKVRQLKTIDSIHKGWY